MNITEKLLRQKQDFDDVYEAGKKAEYDEFWDGIQDYGNRTDYTQGFKNWKGVEAITPKYPIRAINLSELFYQCQKIKSTPMISCANADGKFQTYQMAGTDTRRRAGCYRISKTCRRVRLRGTSSQDCY